MARGPGMTIDEDKAAVTPTGIGTGAIRTFSTDLPNFDNSAQINAGTKLQNLGEELMQYVGQASAKDAALRAHVEVDPQTGEYKRPDAPIMGILTAQTYDHILDQRMVRQIRGDVEKQADAITAASFNDPQKSAALFQRLRESTIKAIPDERLQGLVVPEIDDALQARQRGIMNYRAKEDYKNSVQYLSSVTKDETEKGQGFYAIGDEDRGDAAMLRAHQAEMQMAHLGEIDPRLVTILDKKRESMKTAGKTLSILEGQYAIDKLTPDDLERVETMLRGVDAGEVYGISKERLFQSIHTQQDRDALSSRLSFIRQRLFDRLTQKAQRGEVDLDSFYQQTGRSMRSPVDGDKGRAAWQQWAVRNGGGDPESPVAAAKMYEMTGAFQPVYYKPIFEGASQKSPAQLAKLAGVFNVMKSAVDDKGVAVGQPETAMNADDAAFMHLFARQLETHGDPVKATDEARKLYTEGLKSLAEVKDPSGFLIQEMRQKNVLGNWDGDKIRKSVLGLTDKNLSADNYAQVQQLVALNIATGETSPDAAIARAVASFKQSHQPSPYVLAPGGKANGWVQKEFDVPATVDPRAKGGTTQEWAPPLIERLWNVEHDGKTAQSRTVKERVLDPNAPVDPLTGTPIGGAQFKEVEKQVAEPADPLIPRKQQNITIQPLKLGPDGNTRLLPINNSTKDPAFALYYTPPGETHGIVLRDKDFKAVTVRLGAAAQIQQEGAVRAQESAAWATSWQEKVGGGWGDQAPGTAEKPALAAHIPTSLYLERSALAPTTAPYLGGNVPTSGGSSKFEAKPHRVDGVPNPFKPVPLDGVPVSGLAPEEQFTLARFRRAENPPRLDGIDPGFGKSLVAMINAMPPEVRQGFSLGSTVRTTEEQREIYATSRPGMAAVPGRSNHEHGLAADLQMTPTAKTWVHLNARQFGLHFPLFTAKRRANGTAEDWHIEPIHVRRADLEDGTEES